MTGVVIVGTGFGCITHLRALRNAGFDVQRARRARPREDRANARAASRCRTDSRTSRDALALPGVDAVADRHAAPHARADRARGDRGRQARALREAVRPRRARSAARCSTRREAAGVVHLLGTEFRWASGQASMARVVARGEIGTPKLATFLLHIPMLADPAGEVPDVVGRRRAGRRLARRAGRARDRPGARDARRDRGRERVAHAGVALATGTSKTATPCTSAPVRASTA